MRNLAALARLRGRRSRRSSDHAFGGHTPDCPVTIAWGEKDRLLIYSRQSARARRLLPDARHVTLHGCGHVPTWDDPEQVARVLLEGSSRARRSRRRRGPARGVTSAAAIDHREGEELDDDAEHVGGHRVAEDDDAAGDAGDVGGGRGRGDDRDGLAVLQAAGRGVEADDRAEDGDEEPGRDEDRQEAVAGDAGERLDGDVGDAEEDAGRAAEHDAVVVVRGAEARAA